MVVSHESVLARYSPSETGDVGSPVERRNTYLPNRLRGPVLLKRKKCRCRFIAAVGDNLLWIGGEHVGKVEKAEWN